ncbi:MAG: GNAT family N-acetyltransferase [Planctomycetota bacterium]|nr:GNAT family N-acetyltransferase [Planctomycetota bacterium]
MSISHANPSQLQPSDDPDGPILQIGADRLIEGVERLTAADQKADPEHARRFIQFASENQIDLKKFWARADHQGNLLHSTLCVPSPGRTCMMFSTNPSKEGDIRSVAGVIKHACLELVEGELDLAQALLEPSEKSLHDAYLRAGFTPLATLHYLERPLPTRLIEPESAWPDDVTITTYKNDQNVQLERILDDSYTNTLDCPGLFGLRDTRDILEGHRASGEFDPSLWFILNVDGQPRGVLLLNPAPASHAVELVYMGLAPNARGRGLGRRLLTHGLNALVGRREHNVTLAVDENNAPAQELYRRAGFRAVLRRRALIRSLRSKDA